MDAVRGGRRDTWSTGRPDRDTPRRRLSVVGTLTVVTVLLTATLAFADGIAADTDTAALTSPHDTLLVADQAVGTTVAYPFSVTISNTSPVTNDVFAQAGDSVSISVDREGAWVDAQAGTPNQLTLTSYRSQAGGTIRITVPPDACDVTETMYVALRAAASNHQAMSPSFLSLRYRITGTGTCDSGDTDRDGVSDNTDNCQAVANQDQADADQDGIGDVCDPNAFSPDVHRHADPDPITGPEGSPMEVTGSFADADGTTPEITQGDGRGHTTDEGGGSWTWGLMPGDDSHGDVQVIASDGEHRAADSFSWRSLNVAPTADLTNDGPIDEGGTATVSFTDPVDPSSIDTSAGFHYGFSCDGGALPTTYDDAGTDISTPCTFGEDGTYPVSGRIFDKDGGYTDYTSDVVVRNVAPTIEDASLSGATGTACMGGTVTALTFAWSDPAGANDTYSYDVDWGDGSPHATGDGAVSPVSGLVHTYAAGSFTLSITVSDEDGSTSDASMIDVRHQYASSGLLSPVGRPSYRLGSTIPIKMRVTDCSGAAVSTLLPRVHLALDGAETQLAAPNGADATMRYLGGADGQYLLTLSTKRSQFTGRDLAPGAYHLWVDVPEIARADTWFELR
jgi:hypothetical protein